MFFWTIYLDAYIFWGKCAFRYFNSKCSLNQSSHQRKVSIHFCKIVKKDMQILKNSTLHEQRFTWTESCIKSGSYVNVSNFKQKIQQEDLLLAWHCKHFCYKLHVLLNSNKCIFAQDLFYNFNKRTFFYTFLF